MQGLHGRGENQQGLHGRGEREILKQVGKMLKTSLRLEN